MMNREKNLLRVFIGISLLIFVILTCVSLFQRLWVANKSITEYKEKITKLSSVAIDAEEANRQLERILVEVEKVERKNLIAEKTPISEFGQKVMWEFQRQGIKPQRYSTVTTAGGVLLEFSLLVDASAVFSFLRNAVSGENRWSVPYVNMRTRPDAASVDVVLRITQ